MLRECVLFKGLSEAQVKRVVELARTRRRAPGSLFFQQNEPATAFYVLVEGAVKLLRVYPDGREIILSFIGPADSFGFAAILGDEPYYVTAQATEDSRALAWQTRQVDRMMKDTPLLPINALHFVVRRVLEAGEWLPDLVTQRMERRLARALLRLMGTAHRRDGEEPVMTIRMTQEDLADYIGGSPYTVNRRMNHFRHMGIIQFRRGKIMILRPERLAAVAAHR